MTCEEEESALAPMRIVLALSDAQSGSGEQ